MQVTFNTMSLKYNNYSYPNNLPNDRQQPSFSGKNPEEVVSRVVGKKSKFLNKISSKYKAMHDKSTELLAKNGVVKLFDNEVMDKFTDKMKNQDNIFKHFLAVGSAITSGMYMYKTLTNDKLEKDRKSTLAVNQLLTFILSTAGAYALDGYLNDWWQHQTMRYAASTLEDPTLRTDFREAFKKNRQEMKEAKIFNKTAAAADKKDIAPLKAEGFIKDRLKNYIVNDKDRTLFMNRIKGMGLLKSMLVFALVYRYIVPVAVTKPANILCEKYLTYKKEKNAQKAEMN